MSTQGKDQSRSARLGLDKLWGRDVNDDAADRIVATGFWGAKSVQPGRVAALPVRAALRLPSRDPLQAAPLTSTVPHIVVPSISPTVI